MAPAPPLTEAAFTEIVERGCACGSKRLVVEAYVAQKLPLLGGEVFGAPSWGYKGEDLVSGTFTIACSDCKTKLFTSTACPKCFAEGGLERALESENVFSLPTACDDCGSEQLTATAFVPVVVPYEGKRAAKARTQTAPEDPGFHAVAFQCKRCQVTSRARAGCPVCAA